jgi:DNA-binding transcriptional ArsR family regulator
MENPLQPEHCAELLGALADADRLRIIRVLSSGPLNVTEIATALHAPLVNVSHHLQVLHFAGLVQRRKQGRFAVYSLSPDVLQANGADAAMTHLNLGCCRLEIPTAPRPR